MTGRSVSAVMAYTAHREWASRRSDERYASVHASTTRIPAPPYECVDSNGMDDVA